MRPGEGRPADAFSERDAAQVQGGLAEQEAQVGIVGQGLDSAVFISLAFAGVIPTPAIIAAILGQWFVKSAYEAAATPLTYAVVGYLKRAEGIDVYDTDTRFNPLAID